ncbi:MAG: GGDEF domain-containing protein [Lachnospiraceae bacterium]|nr:GGDEF domain-containing protein [Lachnospiraceae bacterium]
MEKNMNKKQENAERISFFDIDKLSKKYMKDNEAEVTSNNQRMLKTISVIYFVVIICYNIIVPVFFNEWGVSYIYQIALIVHIVILALILLRYRKGLRSKREVQIVCAAFQLYVMAFLVIVSLVPFDNGQPAVYFAPIAMGFAVVFIYSFKTAVVLGIVECASLIITTMIFKSDVLFINGFSTILSLVIVIYVVYVVYANRARESKHRKKLRKMGQTDKLTNIYNRAATEMMSQEYIQENRDKKYALMIIDIDEFKSVNDTYGHQTGDKVIQSVAKIIEEAAGTRNIAGRMGGDEFMIFIKGWNTEDDIKEIAAQILRNAQKIEMPDERVKVSCSIGVCALKEDEWMEYDDMFSCADKALYYIKENGKNCCAFYSKE